MKESGPYQETNHIPGLPETWDELLDCLKEAEEELENGEGTPWEEVTKNARKQ